MSKLIFQVEKFYSKNYSDKEEGLRLLNQLLESYSLESTGTRPDKLVIQFVIFIHALIKMVTRVPNIKFINIQFLIIIINNDIFI